MKTPREILFDRHRYVEPKLDRIWTRIAARPAVAPYQQPIEMESPVGLDRRASRVVFVFWRELIWPCRRVWAGLACVWAFIIVLNVANREAGPQPTGRTTPPSREEMQALAEQRRMLAQLIDTPRESDKRDTRSPGPRSERALRTSAA